MAGPLLFDRVKETATTTGTGTFSLAGAVSGFRSFTSVLSNSDTCYYAIVHQSAAEWETGIGTFTTSGTTLARTSVIASTNSNNAVNFSSGTKDVFITAAAAAIALAGAVTGSGLTMATARLLGRTTASTGAVEELTLGTDVATLIGLPADGTDVDAIGYRGLPQVSFSAATNIIATHNGKTLLHPSSDTNDRTLTIQANGTLALEVGFAFEVINDSANDVTLAITTDTLVQAGSGTTGSITIPQYGTCFVRKIASTRWYATLVDA